MYKLNRVNDDDGWVFCLSPRASKNCKSH
jgi:hypothetical protein